MTHAAWQAHYFASIENSSPPERTELIEAESEDKAAEVARSHMGFCKRVEISDSHRESSHIRVIVAAQAPPDRWPLH
jgi:hypothetical protein